MCRMNLVRVAVSVGLAVLAGLAVPARGQTGITVFEGARLIAGDERAPIENATLVVDGTRIVQVGRAADIQVPAGATRVSLAGKTVMPMMIDTHTHLGRTREALVQDLRRRAYFGVSAALSLGATTTSCSISASRRFPAPPGSSAPDAGSPCRSRDG